MSYDLQVKSIVLGDMLAPAAREATSTSAALASLVCLVSGSNGHRRKIALRVVSIRPAEVGYQ